MPDQTHYLPATYVGAQPLPGFDAFGGGFSRMPSHGMSTHQMLHNISVDIHNYLDAITSQITNDYTVQSQQVPSVTENELALVRTEIPTGPLAPAAAILREIGIRSTLIHRKNAALNSMTATANSFYGSNPVGKTSGEFTERAALIDSNIFNIGPTLQIWANAYQAAYSAALLTQSIGLLTQQQTNLYHQLAVVQTEEQTRLAAQQESQRVAAEMARLKAEEAQREAAELARLNIEKEQRAAAEFNRLRLENEKNLERIKSELAAEILAKEALEQARIAALNAALAEAERQTAAQAQWQEQSLASAGSKAAFGLAFSGTSGTVNVGSAASLALRTALRAAISAITGAVVTATAPVLVGFAALLAPSRLGNGDLYSVSVPLSELATISNNALYELAATKGEIELPVRLGAKTLGNRVEIVVASTDGVTVPTNVPVRLARFDARKNLYVSSSAFPNDPVITWTPLVEPQNPSTSFPIAETDLPVYEGATVTPIKGRIDTSPVEDYGFGGFITVFPAESGIPPLYVVLNSPYEGATTIGEHSGRDFNPEQAGGPIMDLVWDSTTASQDGVEAVKLHTARFPPSDANKVMIDRLEKILKGELEMTDTDKRYYTHEVRELERFRALGYSDGESPDENSPLWNNVHTATLEDYKLLDDETLLYSTEALAAGEEQDERYYQKLLKEMLP